MATEFEDALSEITGGSVATAPETPIEQTQAAPAEESPFDAALAEQLQETPAPDRSQEMPEPGNGMDL